MLLKAACLSLWQAAAVVAQQKPRSLRAGQFFGNQYCTEPEHRFDTSLSNMMSHNTDNINDPTKWHCQFCGTNLYKIIDHICCGSANRIKRDADEMEFWRGITYQDHMAQVSKGKDDRINQEKSKKQNHIKVNSAGNYNPAKLAKSKAHEDCQHDIEHKNGGISTKELPQNMKHIKDHPEMIKAYNAKKDRMKRNIERIPENQNEDGTYPAKWHYSQKNGGKGRSTYEELINEYGIVVMECHPEIASQFLATRSLGGNFAGHTPNRQHFKHTYLQHECCGMGTGAQDHCEMEEVRQMSIHEECCGEGCQIEEIHESCASWRWDMKEDWEETRKGQDWRPDSPYLNPGMNVPYVGGRPVGSPNGGSADAPPPDAAFGANPFANGGSLADFAGIKK